MSDNSKRCRKILISMLAFLCLAISAISAERPITDVEKDLRELSNGGTEKRQGFVVVVKEMLQRLAPQNDVVYQLIDGKLVGPPNAEERQKKCFADIAEFHRVKNLCLSMIAKQKVTEVIDLLIDDIHYDDRFLPPLGYWWNDPSPCVRTLIALGKPASQALMSRLKKYNDIDVATDFGVNAKGEILFDDKVMHRVTLSVYLTTLIGIEKIEGVRRLLEDDPDGKLASVRKFAIKEIFPLGEINLEKQK